MLPGFAHLGRLQRLTLLVRSVKTTKGQYTAWESATENMALEVTHIQQWFNTLHAGKTNKDPTNAMDDLMGNLRTIGTCGFVDSADVARQVCDTVETNYLTKKTVLLATTKQAYSAQAEADLKQKLLSRFEPTMQALRAAANKM